MREPDPFDLANRDAYLRWRQDKLARHPQRLEELIVEVRDPRRLAPAERNAIFAACARANLAIYASACGADPDKDIARRLAAAIGLKHLDANYLADDDGITLLAVAGHGTRSAYIPYTNRGIKWHTDGYYNEPDRLIRGMVLHCVRSAASGGENRLLDHEIAYLWLRDANPDFIAALSAPDAMTIPARVEEDGVARPAQAGPVFSVDGLGHLHMRYTARTRSIAWKQDARTREAVRSLETMLACDSPWIFRARLEPGMGLVCNNVLHDRAAFSDAPDRPRLLYRARYFERIAQPAG